jgi:hypothetical protein
MPLLSDIPGHDVRTDAKLLEFICDHTECTLIARGDC